MKALLLLALFAGTAEALDPGRALSQYRRRSWDMSDGLPSGTIRSLAQTRDGYLWAGTEEGLARFDGERFKVYDRATTDGVLGDAFIISSAMDRQGRLWVGTKEGRLYRVEEGRVVPVPIDGGINAWIRAIHVAADDTVRLATSGDGLLELRHGQWRRRKLPGDKVYAVTTDEAGVVWVGTDRGLVRIDGDQLTVPLSGDKVISLLPVAGELWMGTADAGIKVLKDAQIRSFAEGGKTVRAIVRDRDGALWFGTNQGVVRYLGGSFTRFGSKEGLLGDNVWALLEDGEGDLWVGTASGGLTRFSETRFTPLGVTEGLSNDVVWTVTETSDGSVWAATSMGLNRLYRGQLTHYTQKDGLGDNAVLSLHEDAAGTLWVGTYAGGIHRMRDGVLNPFAPAINGASALYVDGGGTLWVGTSGGGIFRVKDGVKQPFAPESPASRFVTSCITGALDGGVWICSDGAGLLHWKDGALTVYDQRSLSSAEVSDVYEDGESLWVGTLGGGLNRRRAGRWTHYGHQQGLCDDTVYRVLDDRLGRLWMTSGHGIFRVDKANLDALDGGERRGLACTLYDGADGLRTPEASGGYGPAGARARDGRLWFPTARGLVSVDPAYRPRNQSPPPVRVEEIVADGRHDSGARIAPGRGSLEIHYTALSLKAPERVRFRYRLEGFDRDWIDAGGRRVAYYTNLPPGRYTFRVKACNDAGVWNDTGASLSLTLLPHFYQTGWFYALLGLLLLAVAVAIYRLQLGRLRAQRALLTRLVEVRTESLRRSNHELKQAQAQLIHSEKMSALGQLVAGVAHELNNPVNFISCNIDFLDERYRQLTELIEFLESRVTPEAENEVAQKKQQIDFEFIRSDAPDLVQAFRNGAERIASIVDNLRLFSRGGDVGQQPTDLAVGLRTTLRLLESMFRDRVHVDLDLDPDLPLVRCNGGQINQVFMNLLVNAVQAMGKQGVLSVRARRHDAHVIFQFTDTGPGVPMELRGRIFEPFFTTKEVGQGTGLGLSISFGIVADHDGTIEVGGAPGEGATFTITLPVGAGEVTQAAAV